jgi:UDP-N-acetylmuramoylalanine--D-glutamate ligase
MPQPGQRVITFSLLDPAADYFLARDPEPVLTCRGEALLPMSAIKLQGEHNAANALAALAMCEALELPRAPVLEALASFGGLAHRAQWVADVAGVRYVNDSKGTNVGATIAAISGMAGPLVLIAGGDGKNQDFDELRPVCRGKVRHAVLIGRDALRLEAAFEGVCSTERAAGMRAAVGAARAAAQPGDTVLLSPACASLDMFRDYAHRGDEFATAVRSLEG